MKVLRIVSFGFKEYNLNTKRHNSVVSSSIFCNGEKHVHRVFIYNRPGLSEFKIRSTKECDKKKCIKGSEIIGNEYISIEQCIGSELFQILNVNHLEEEKLRQGSGRIAFNSLNE